MLHEPAAPAGKDYAVAYKTRLGVWMFICYSLFYASFVALNLSMPQLMEEIIVFGLNVATVFGFALIIVALIQAIIYSALCTKQERLHAAREEGGE
ncbi:MAG: DUF485 domain-containing protein [Armatimonadota bacterium]